MAKKHSVLILVFSLFAFSFIALGGPVLHAQVRDTDIVLSLSPEFPTSNQNVTATLSSYAINLDKANISWSVNNQAVSYGVGKKVFLFTTGNLGATQNISVVVDTIDGQSIQKQISITPTNVDMLWQAYDSYTPPFYKGKTLAASESTIKVVAIPSLSNQNGKIGVNNLSYIWNKDGDVQTKASGWGKNFLIFPNSYLDKGNVVQVKVSDIAGSTNSSGSITLQTSTPKVLFYENNPRLGTKWENALTDGTAISSDGETLVAEPYFFSPKNIYGGDLTFDWSLNGTPVQTPDIKNMLSVKPTSGQSGQAVVQVVVNNAQTLFQSVTKTINVEF